MKMVANETELRNALKERAPEITIVTSYADSEFFRAYPIVRKWFRDLYNWDLE